MAGRVNPSTSLLQRLHQVKQLNHPPAAVLGTEMMSFFKQSVQKRQTKMGHIAGSWSMLVPETLNEHCSLESLHGGVLTVIVDSSSHLYELKQLLLAGLQQQVLLACRTAGVRKIALRPGRWYDDAQAGGSPRYD
jgi:predicted nucleic acid-binding Zn ribbon protein